MLMPSGSARPFRTSSICGYVRSDTQNVFRAPGGLARLHAMQQRHRFAGRRRFVEQRRRGDLHRRQIAHHRLEIEERFQPALRDLGLIRRVGRVPRRVFEEVSQNHARRDGAVVAHADERLEPLVLRGHRREAGRDTRARFRRAAAAAAS